MSCSSSSSSLSIVFYSHRINDNSLESERDDCSKTLLALYFHFLLTFFLFIRTNRNQLRSVDFFFSFAFVDIQEREWVSNTTQWIDSFCVLSSEWCAQTSTFSLSLLLILFRLKIFATSRSISDWIFLSNERTSTNDINKHDEYDFKWVRLSWSKISSSSSILCLGRILTDVPCKVCHDNSSGKHYGIFACDG